MKTVISIILSVFLIGILFRSCDDKRECKGSVVCEAGFIIREIKHDFSTGHKEQK